MIKNLNKLFYL